MAQFVLGVCVAGFICLISVAVVQRRERFDSLGKESNQHPPAETPKEFAARR
jgi:hypothetical protein